MITMNCDKCGVLLRATLRINESWKAEIRLSGKNVFLGHFVSEESAAAAYSSRAIQEGRV